jgi:UDP-N-acetyl-2-amino-2-deoxyglucuronate dehydrogenase
LSYVTRRGKWYHNSWKGAEEKSGGLAMNIGIHFFDLLLWLFGPASRAQVHQAGPTRMSGYLELKRARVRWLLSIDEHDLPADVRAKNGFAYRSLTLDGREVDLSERFTDLHTEVYKDIQSGGGFGIADARPAIDLVYQIRNTRPAPSDDFAHPLTRSLAAV